MVSARSMNPKAGLKMTSAHWSERNPNYIISKPFEHPADKRFYDLLGGLNAHSSLLDIIKNTDPMVIFDLNWIFDPYVKPLVSLFYE